MITVTERAKVVLQDLLHQKINIPLACLRISPNEKGGYGLGVDVEVAGDQSVIFGGEKILIVDEQLAVKLDNMVMDFEETNHSHELVLMESIAKKPVAKVSRQPS